jgi:hypothetical protein
MMIRKLQEEKKEEREERKHWVKVRELVDVMFDEYKVAISENKLGRRLKQEWKLPHRSNDGSEFKF